MPYRKKAPKGEAGGKGNPHWYVRVPTRNGGSVQMSTRSTEKSAAKRIERMLAQFTSGRKREYFDLIDAVHDGRLRLLDLLEADDHNTLDELRTRLSPPAPVPLAPSITPEISRWERWLADTVKPDTSGHYITAVLTFVETHVIQEAQRNARENAKNNGAAMDEEHSVPALSREDLLAAYCPASALTTPTLYGWLTDLEVGASSKRKYHAAMRSFIDHLIRAGAFTGDNPMDKVPMPPAADPRTHYLETYEAVRLVHAFADPIYRAFNALMAGSGIEVSAALNVRRRDVFAEVREVRAPGTKTYTRDRIVRVAEWAWPFIEALLPGLGPDDKLFTSIQDRWIARDVFVATIFPLAMQFDCYHGYTMRDHRHTYAVRAARAGTPPQLIAEQLGHRDAVLVLKVYGRFLAKSDERDRWEQKAALLDEKAGITPASASAVPVPTSEPPARASRTNIEWPAVPELLEMLSAASASAVAERLGVSDVALRKHLKKHGVTKLPDGRRSGVTRSPSPTQARED